MRVSKSQQNFQLYVNKLLAIIGNQDFCIIVKEDYLFDLF